VSLAEHRLKKSNISSFANLVIDFVLIVSIYQLMELLLICLVQYIPDVKNTLQICNYVLVKTLP
jgi:hypothetical protein